MAKRRELLHNKETMRILHFSFILGCVIMAACSGGEGDSVRFAASKNKEQVSAHPPKEKSLSQNQAHSNKEQGMRQTSGAPVSSQADVFATLPEEMQTIKTQLEEKMRADYGQSAAARAGDFVLEYHQAVRSAAQKARTPAEVIGVLKELDQEYQKKLESFLQQESLRNWQVPTAVQLEAARKEMEKKKASMQKEISVLYGPVCAQHAQAVLDQATAVYMEALATAKTGAELQTRTQQAQQRLNAALQQIVQQYGDPKGAMSREELLAMRAEMINAYQAVEARFERLYGKEAALEIRPLFNQILKNAAAVGAADTRLSYKREELARLNKIYKQQLADMQTRFNERLKKDSKR